MKKKWRNLHDSYKRIKCAQTGRGNDDEETPTNWPFFQSMLFLEDIKHFRRQSKLFVLSYEENWKVQLQFLSLLQLRGRNQMPFLAKGCLEDIICGEKCKFYTFLVNLS